MSTVPMAPQQLSARMTAFNHRETAAFKYRQATDAGYATALDGRTVESEAHLRVAAKWEQIRDTWQAELDRIDAMGSAA